MTDSLSRRNFLAAAAGAAALPAILSPSIAAAALPATLVANPDYQFDLNRGDKVKTGIIGVGGRGNALLGEVLKSQQADMVAICDIRPEAVASATARCAGMTPKGYSDYRALLDDKTVEAVIIATPVDLHGEMALAAMKAGKHIYCEKPVGLTGIVNEAFYHEAKGYNKTFQFGFQWMYNQGFRAAIEAVHDNAIGGILYIHAQRHGGDLPRDKGKDWLFDRTRSGDIIVEQAVHEMNVFCWGTKSRPAKAAGFGGTNCYINEPAGRSIFDHYSLSYEFPGPCHLSYSHLYYAAGLGGTHIHFFGPKGAVDVMAGKIYLADGAKAPEPRETGLTREDTFNAIVSFFDDVRKGTKPLAGPERAYLATMMCVMGREAVYSGKPVTWDDARANETVADFTPADIPGLDMVGPRHAAQHRKTIHRKRSEDGKRERD